MKVENWPRVFREVVKRYVQDVEENFGRREEMCCELNLSVAYKLVIRSVLSPWIMISLATIHEASWRLQGTGRLFRLMDPTDRPVADGFVRFLVPEQNFLPDITNFAKDTSNAGTTASYCIKMLFKETSTLRLRF